MKTPNCPACHKPLRRVDSGRTVFLWCGHAQCPATDGADGETTLDALKILTENLNKEGLMNAN